MVLKHIVPHGDWESPIGLEDVASKSRPISAPRHCRQLGRSFFAQNRPVGGKTLYEVTPKGPKDILPAEYTVANAVYEYGGSLYDVLPDGRLIFSNKDNSIRLLNPDTGRVSLIAQDPVLRYCGFHASPNSPWVLAIEEDHTHDTPTTIQDYIVAININTTEIRRIITGADFYYLPSFSYDGTQLTWLEWNRPEQLFESSRMYRAKWNTGASISDVELIAGSEEDSVTEPRWGPDGSLFFCKEAGEYRELFRVAPGDHNPKKISLSGMEETEFGEVRLFEGSRTYTPLSARYVLASGCTNGTSQLITIDLETGSWKPTVGLETVCHVYFDAVARVDEHSALVIGAGLERGQTLHQIDIRGSEYNTVISESIDKLLDLSWYSKPEHVEIDSISDPSRKVHGFLWLPRNPKHTAPEGQLPPLIVSAHGGPTGYSGCGLTQKVQYFTSRGYAYCLLNYNGSTGHGRTYRRNLYENWGIFDADDAADLASHFVSQGITRPGAAGITGLSAGGYNTLMALVRHPKAFAGGFCVSGISDLQRFDDTTHKLEYDYTPALVLPKGSSKEDKIKLYRERSALYHLDEIESPLFLLHGKADTVVPLEQASLMADALKKKGKEVEIIEVEDEGHMMAKPSSMRTWVSEEEKWWRRTLLRV